MAWTKINFYLTGLLVAITFFSTMGIIGTDIINSDRLDVNEKSVDYILEIKGVSSDSGFEAVAETDSGESQSKGILDSEDNKTVSESNDFLSTLYIKKERASEPTNFFKLVYNIPSSIVIAIGWDVSDFRHIINIFGVIMVVALIIMIWNKVVGR